MLTPSQQFHQALSEACSLARSTVTAEYDRLADSFDLGSALYCVRRFLTSGETTELAVGIQIIHNVIIRHEIGTHPEPERQPLHFLHALGNSMPKSERQNALSLFEEGLSSSSWTSRGTPPEQVDLLVISALREPELRCFLEQMSCCSEIASSNSSEMAGFTYYEGTLKNSEASSLQDPIRTAALCQNQPGPVDCAALVVNGIRLFKPKLIAMTGVCIGRPQMGILRTDLVIPNAALNRDSPLSSEQSGRISRWCELNPKIIHKIRSQGPSILNTIARHTELARLSPKHIPQISTDAMSCSAIAEGQEVKVDQIADSRRRIIGFDGESYSFLRAAKLTDEKVETLIVKGVMDFSTGDPQNVKEHAAFWAAAFLANFLVSEFKALCPLAK